MSSEEFFDGIILDDMLPDMNELELGTMMRRSLPKTPIFLTTGYVDKITPEMAKSAGFNAVLPRPYSMHIVDFIAKNVRTQSLKYLRENSEGIVPMILGNLYSD